MNESPAHLPAASSVVDDSNPWVGLSTFTEEQKSFFHGRDGEQEELLRLVHREPLTVLFGLSGLGKSSLLQAGVFPALRSEGWLPVSLRLDHSPDAAHPVTQIKNAVVHSVEASGLSFHRLPAAEESLWEFFHSRDAGVCDAEGKPVTLLLAFDQFEEIFTLGKSADATGARRDALLGELADLVGNRVPKPLGERLELDSVLIENLDFDRSDYRVLISLREDYLAELESLRAKMPLILQNRMRLRPMDGRQAMQAVIEPGGKLVSKEVAERIVRFVSHSKHEDVGLEKPEAGVEPLENLKVEPSLLSLFCRELNTRRAAQGLSEITPELLASSSGRILHDFYEQCFEGLPLAARAFIEDELLTDTGFRENMALPSARKRLAARGVPAPDAVIETLVARRLLHIEERQDLQRIELTHDVLTDVVMKGRTERHKREQEIEARRRDAEREASIAEARKRELAAIQELHLTRRRSAFFALLALLAIAGLTVALFSYREAMRQGAELERQKQRETELAASSRRDASLSDMITASTIVRGTLTRAGNVVALLSRAVERDPSNRSAFVSLMSILGSSSWPLPAMPAIALPESPGGAAFSSDGRQIVIFYGNVVGVWDAVGDSGMQGLPQTFPARVLGAKFSLDGQSLIIALQDGTAAVRGTPDSPQTPSRDIKLSDAITSVKFSEDRRFLAAAAGEDILLLEIATGLSTRLPAGGAPLVMRFTPDGARLAAGIQTSNQGGLTRVWKTADGAGVPELSGRQDVEPRVLAFSPDGSSLAASSKESVLVHQKNGARSSLKLLSEVTCLEFSHDGYYFAAGSRNGEVVIARNPEIDSDVVVGGGGECPPMEEVVRATWGGPVVSIEFSPDALRALIAVADGTVWLLDIAEIRPPEKSLGTSFGGRVGRAAGWVKSQPIRQSGETVTAKFSPDGCRVLVASKNNAVRVWGVLPNQMQPALLPAAAPVASFAVAEAGAGKWAAAVAEDGSCVLWGVQGGQYAAIPVPASASPVMSTGFDPTGTRFWTASADGTVTLWTAQGATGISLAHPSRPSRIAIPHTTQGDFLLTACGREIRLLALAGDPNAAPRVLSPPDSGESFQSVALSSDATLLAASADKQVYVWDLRTPEAPPLALPLNTPATLLSFVPGANTLAVTSGRRVLLFEAGSVRPSASLPHAEDVSWMRFLPDGTLVTCSAKEVWQWRGAVPVGDALPHQSNIAAAATSPDGDFLITGCDDETVRIWELDSGLLVFERSFPGMGIPSVGFNADASAFFTVFQGRVLAWDFPGNVTTVPKVLPALGFAISGTEFSGNRVRLSFSDINKQLDDASAAILRAPAPADQSWVRWLAQIDDKDRPVSPSSLLTRLSLAEKLIASGTRESLQRALLLVPGNPGALEKLSAVLRDKSPDDPRAPFLEALAKKLETK